MLCRQIEWKKVRHDNIWRATMLKSAFGFDCKLIAYAGVGGSSVANRHSVLEVLLPQADGSYMIMNRFEFYNAWKLKEYIDVLLFLLWNKRKTITEEESRDWFINELNSRPTIEPPINGSGYSISGYPI